ncbi:hypothetical protein HWB05_gp014 [Streptomyces phage BRock]|uniref:Uncharacterized protein n=1 Tax=Streptomyces phage BRock TaxID=1913591 RepID=A0A1J0GVS5_9CAUD|nr:hypothetical protein HWB05_gp014 [Streptomyces phage BRock]APC46276.1 hypothetical protein [Streptomyces phage BRock]
MKMHKGWKITFPDKNEEYFLASQLPRATRTAAVSNGSKVERVFILK